MGQQSSQVPCSWVIQFCEENTVASATSSQFQQEGLCLHLAPQTREVIARLCALSELKTSESKEGIVKQMAHTPHRLCRR